MGLVFVEVEEPAPAVNDPPGGPVPEGPPESLRNRFSINRPGVQAAIAAAEKAEEDRRRREPVHEYIVQFSTTASEAEEIMRMLKAHRICDSHYRFYPVKDKEKGRSGGMDKA